MQWNKLRPSTPIPVRVLSETQFSSDKQDFIRVGDKKQKKLYFHVPNVPHDEVQRQFAIGSNRPLKQLQDREIARAMSLQQTRDASTKRQQESMKQKAAQEEEHLRKVRAQTTKAELFQTVEDNKATIGKLEEMLQQQKATIQQQ